MIKRIKGLLGREAQSASTVPRRELPPTAAQLYSLAPTPGGTAAPTNTSTPAREATPSQLPSLAELAGNRKQTKDAPSKRSTEGGRSQDVVTEDELYAFEQALAGIENNPDADPEARTSALAGKEASDGFFQNFESALHGEDLRDVAEEIIHEDILRRMKQFHAERQKGKTYYVSQAHLKKALQAKLKALKTLEHAWLEKKQELSSLSQMIEVQEHQIDKHTLELKELLAQYKQASILESRTPDEHAFLCKDGRKLQSLLELRQALLHAPEDLWKDHFHGESNDFARWAQVAFKDVALSEKIGSARDSKELLSILGKL
ncbi:MAG: hypothetical protein HC945_04270 [Nitrosarchaeum sp.]|nr:hypothetical protein [Nitrosarchaeum sp.]